MNNTAATKQRSQVKVQDASKVSASTEIDKMILGSIVAFTSVIALWSVACLMSAMFQAGGPLQLVGGYLKAIAGS